MTGDGLPAAARDVMRARLEVIGRDLRSMGEELSAVYGRHSGQAVACRQAVVWAARCGDMLRDDHPAAPLAGLEAGLKFGTSGVVAETVAEPPETLEGDNPTGGGS